MTRPAFATPTGLAGQADAKVNAKRTFDPDHTVRADRVRSVPRRDVLNRLFAKRGIKLE